MKGSHWNVKVEIAKKKSSRIAATRICNCGLGGMVKMKKNEMARLYDNSIMISYSHFSIDLSIYFIDHFFCFYWTITTNVHHFQ